MSIEYLLKEYELSYKQLQYYDDRHSNILKYTFTLTSSVATAQFAIFRFFQGATQDLFAFQAILSVIVFVATLLLYLAMLQNRLYFFFMARQLNAIRGYLMITEAGDFHSNQLYTSTDFPVLKPTSVHTFQLLGVALISSLFAGMSAYALNPAFGNEASKLIACIVFMIIAAVEIVGGIIYLSSVGKKSADHVIHGESAKSQ